MFKNDQMMVIPDMKMLDVIHENPYFLLMLEHFGISIVVDEKTIMQICSENKINCNLFLSFANLFNGTNPFPLSEYSFDDVNNIIKYLKNCHQYYTEESYPKIQAYIMQLQDLGELSEISLIQKFFTEYFNEVSEHLNYENQVVFPYAISLYNQLGSKGEHIQKTNFAVGDYKEHHNDIEEKLTDLKNLLLKYLPQKEDQQIRRNLLLGLYELEYDLHVHSQIEDLILIPLLEKMEQTLISRK